jgi:hypothetical protein
MKPGDENVARGFCPEGREVVRLGANLAAGAFDLRDPDIADQTLTSRGLDARPANANGAEYPHPVDQAVREKPA